MRVALSVRQFRAQAALLLRTALLVVALAGCAEVARDSARTMQASTEASSTSSQSSMVWNPSIIDNTEDFPVSTQDETDIRHFIGHDLKAAYLDKNSNRSELTMTPNFVRLETDVAGRQSRQDRDSFMTSLSAANVKHVAYRIGRIIVLAGGEQAVALVASSYGTRYFDYNFLEGLILTRSPAGWRLKQQTLRELPPDEGAVRSAAIFLVDRDPSEVGEALKSGGRADGIVEAATSGSTVDSISGDERMHTVLFILRATPPKGTILTVEHQFDRPNLDELGPYVSHYTVEDEDGFYVIGNGTHASYGCSGGPSCAGGTITYRIFMSERKLGEETVRIEGD